MSTKCIFCGSEIFKRQLTACYNTVTLDLLAYPVCIAIL